MYESLTGLGAAPAATGSPEAWAAYVTALRDSLVERRASAIKAYNTLKSIRESFGLPFMGSATGESADLGVWPPDYEAQAVDILAMTKICVDAANDVLAGKRKLFWDEQIQDFAVEGFSSDALRLQYGAQGQPVLIDAATGNEVHVSGQVGIAPVVVIGIVALAVVQGLGVYLIVDKALDTLGSAILQRTQRTLAEAAKKHAELVEQGKATPEQAEKLNKGLYAGASDLERAAGEKQKQQTNDIADAVKTVAWVALGVGVLYVGAQLLGSMKFGGALAGAAARDNPDYTKYRSTYLPAELRDVPPFTPSGTDLEIWTWETERRSPKTGEMVKMFHGIAFAGKAGKPLWHYWFSTAASRMNEIEKSIAARKAHLKWRDERMGKRKDFQHTLKPGDVLYTSFGYDETHVDFYEVIETKGKSVVVCKIGKKLDHSSTGADYVVAMKGKCFGKVMTKRVGEGNSVKIDDHYAGFWDGKPKYETAAGWGH